ncbi:MAG: AAA family ATPase [Acidobacteriota bacterium]
MHCYVRNFSEPDRPRLIELPFGQGRLFSRRIRALADFLTDGFAIALESSAAKSRSDELQQKEQQSVGEITKNFEKRLAEAGLELVTVRESGISRPAILPVVDGKPLKMEELEALVEEGALTAERKAEFEELVKSYLQEFQEVTSRVGEVMRSTQERQRETMEAPARGILEDMTRSIRAQFPGDDVRVFLEELVDDVVENRLDGSNVKDFDAQAVYDVRLLEERAYGQDRPVIIENNPTLVNLVGGIERDWSPESGGRNGHRMIRAGSLYKADGGYLILDARDVLSEPGVWRLLQRTLSSGNLEIVPPEIGRSAWSQSLKPEPIPVNVRVILVGDTATYRHLDKTDPNFSDLFKVQVWFDSTFERDPAGIGQYAGVVARLVEDGESLHFTAAAVGALAEHGSRIGDRAGRLSSQLPVIADTAREASYLATQDKAETVGAQHVAEAVARSHHRGALPSRRYRELLKEGTFNVVTSGEIVGQVNGLAVMRAGTIKYGLPARITATVGPGDGGIVDIESQAELTGKIYQKGFHILEGLLLSLLRTDHPLTLTASLAFEQSYGGMDGDSASGAELCCLLSALSGLPIDQGVAITGAIDQHGRLQAVGGVNEKIEGFFDACSDAGMGPSQGAIIPTACVRGLMLRQDVIEACRDGRFKIYATGRIEDALEILLGAPVGSFDEGPPGPDTILGRVRARVKELWEQSQTRS